MSLMTPFNAPSQEAEEDVLEVYRAIRRFDYNHGRSFDNPVTDPHGRLLSELTMDELHDVATWCMLPEFHEAISREFWIRKLRREGANQYERPIGPEEPHTGLEPSVEEGYDHWPAATEDDWITFRRYHG